MDNSMVNKIFSEDQHTKARQQLLIDLKEELKNNLNIDAEPAAYIANTLNPAAFQNAGMNLHHEKFIYDVLRDCRNSSENLALIIVSPGGEVNFVNRLVRLIKEDLKFKQFYVIAPHIAKSAATLLTLVADKLIVGELSQFGPIDPQLPRVVQPGVVVWIPARVVKDSIEKTLKEEIKNYPPTAQAGIAASIDWIFYQQSLDAIELVKELVKTYAESYNKALSVDKILREMIECPLSHAQDIPPNKLGDYGVDIAHLDGRSHLWGIISEYYTRALRHLNLEQRTGDMGLVLFENARVSMSMSSSTSVAPRSQQTNK